MRPFSKFKNFEFNNTTGGTATTHIYAKRVPRPLTVQDCETSWSVKPKRVEIIFRSIRPAEPQSKNCSERQAQEPFEALPTSYAFSLCLLLEYPLANATIPLFQTSPVLVDFRSDIVAVVSFVDLVLGRKYYAAS